MPISYWYHSNMFQRNNRFNILWLLNCLPCNQTYSSSLPLSYLYISMNFSSFIHGLYPRLFLDQQFWLNWLSAVHNWLGIFNTNHECGVKRPKVQYSKQQTSMTDAFEVIIWMFCLQMVSDKSLRNEICTYELILSKIHAFKMHFKVAFSNFDPSWNQTDLWTLIFQFLSQYSFWELWIPFSHLDIK